MDAQCTRQITQLVVDRGIVDQGPDDAAVFFEQGRFPYYRFSLQKTGFFFLILATELGRCK